MIYKKEEKKNNNAVFGNQTFGEQYHCSHSFATEVSRQNKRKKYTCINAFINKCLYIIWSHQSHERHYYFFLSRSSSKKGKNQRPVIHNRNVYVVAELFDMYIPNIWWNRVGNIVFSLLMWSLIGSGFLLFVCIVYTTHYFR